MAGVVNNFSANQNWQSIGGNGFSGYNNQGGYGGPVAREIQMQAKAPGRRAVEHADGTVACVWIESAAHGLGDAVQVDLAGERAR